MAKNSDSRGRSNSGKKEEDEKEDTRCIDEIDELKKIFYTFFVLTEKNSMTDNKKSGLLSPIKRQQLE